nr:GNAT family protein [Actinoplanes atraurantiacus]
MVDNDSGACVGEAVLNDWEPANESCNFRILIGPAGRGRGLGTEATTLILDHAFTALRLHRVGLEVYAFNPRARHVYEKAGFTVEGTKRDALLFDGERVDAIMMSVIARPIKTGVPG